jgi:hypothetical protein
VKSSFPSVLVLAVCRALSGFAGILYQIARARQ